ncbi:MAG: 3-dehydroquinate synthase [Kineosporiaceae bacterium]
MKRIRVGGGFPGEPAEAGAYDVVVGHDLLDQLPDLVAGAQRVLVLSADTVAATAQLASDRLCQAGYEIISHRLPDAEKAKTTQVLDECWALLGQASFTRTDAVVAVGGGSVTDLGGFVAATWLRGVRVVHVPTTLLGMVDAAVGGKTGINTVEGKNLVGAFHPPSGVLCDLDTLLTLPRADLVAGMAEVVKAGFIADPAILRLVEADPQAALAVDGEVLAELVHRAIAVKADVVTQDLKESSLREILNYGHTFGHAIEQVSGYTWRHGEAVAVGMMFAAELGRLVERTPPELVSRHRDVLESVGLPTSYAGDAGWADLVTAMSRDKKTRGSTLRFVVLDDVARPGRLVGPSEELLAQVYEQVRAR